jgi:RNA polymerase sigma factor (sigma-70 family)
VREAAARKTISSRPAVKAPVLIRGQVTATDNDLMASVGEGDLAKLAVLFERHHRALFRYFVSMNRDRELAQDLVQDVFFRILRYRSTYDSGKPFTAWMYQIARRASLDRSAARRGEVIGIEEFTERGAEPASTEPGPEEHASQGQNLALLRRAFEQLPAEKREVLLLSRFQEMKYEEIATVLGCEVATVKVRVYRAVRALEQIYFALERSARAV